MAAGGVWEELVDPETHAVLELNFYPDKPPYREGEELDHLGFRVTDLDTTLTRLQTLGARVRIPPFREGEERLAFVSDPDGIWLELYETPGALTSPTSRGGE